MKSDKEIVLTKSGRDKLKKELDRLLNVDRRAVAKRLKEARAHGDVSDNPEFEDAKNEQSFVEGRIKSLRHILKYAKVVEETKLKTEKVELGLTVVLRDLESGGKQRFKIVSTVEADPDLSQISDESPVGRALIGKKVGEVAEIDLPHGALKYRIEEIKR